jgi:hypothetical protein
MRADDENPAVRWKSISDWYDEFARERGWEFLRPMVDLTAWVAEQPWAAGLFPDTSLQWLGVKLQPGYHPDSPSFSCVARADGQFECRLWAAVGRRLERKLFPLNEAQSAFWNFVRRLQGVTYPAVAADRLPARPTLTRDES